MTCRRTIVAALLLVCVGSSAPREAAAQDRSETEPAKPARGVATKETEASVMWALRWLKNHQSPDGRWDSDGFDAQCKLNRCDGGGGADEDVAATGVSLLAFLAAGETQKSGTCRKSVGDGLNWLCDAQDADGCVGPRTAPGWLRRHVIATLALVEAYGMTSDKSFKAPAERGIAFAVKARKPEAARLGADGEFDVETAGWTVMLLKSGIMSELAVDKADLSEAVADLEKRTDASGSVVVKASAGVGPTAIGVLGRIFGGHALADDPQIARGADVVAKSPPAWPADAAGVDLVGLHFETLAIFQLGGERWKAWNTSMTGALLPRQHMEADRDERGSWDPAGVGAKTLGRIEATALCCLDLEVYYRYGRVLELNKKKEKDPSPTPPPAGGK